MYGHDDDGDDFWSDDGDDFAVRNYEGADGFAVAQGPVFGGAGGFAQTASQGVGFRPVGYDANAARLEEIQTRRDGGAPAVMAPDGSSPSSDVIVGSAVGSDEELAEAQRRNDAQNREAAALARGDRRAAYAARQEYDASANAARAYPDQAVYVGGGTVVLGEGGAPNTVTGGTYVDPVEAQRRSEASQAERERQRQTGTGRYQMSEEQRRASMAASAGALPGALASLFTGAASQNPFSQLLTQVLGGAQLDENARATAARVLGVAAPQLEQIRRLVEEQQYSLQATAEHRALMDEQQWRDEVLARMLAVDTAVRQMQRALDQIGPARW